MLLVRMIHGKDVSPNSPLVDDLSIKIANIVSSVMSHNEDGERLGPKNIIVEAGTRITRVPEGFDFGLIIEASPSPYREQHLERFTNFIVEEFSSLPELKGKRCFVWLRLLLGVFREF